MGALLQINPVWLYGPYNPAEVTAGSQPDWYMGWLEGSVRIMPGFESHFWGITLSWNLIIPALIIPPAFVTLVALYPFIEGWITGDKREHHLLDRPRDVPTRTGIGVAFITFYGLLWIAGGNDLVATHFGVVAEPRDLVPAVRGHPRPGHRVLDRPPLVAISLQRADNDRLLHGLETGIIIALPRRRVHREAPARSPSTRPTRSRPATGSSRTSWSRTPTTTASAPRAGPSTRPAPPCPGSTTNTH